MYQTQIQFLMIAFMKLNLRLYTVPIDFFLPHPYAKHLCRMFSLLHFSKFFRSPFKCFLNLLHPGILQEGSLTLHFPSFILKHVNCSYKWFAFCRNLTIILLLFFVHFCLYGTRAIPKLATGRQGKCEKKTKKKKNTAVMPNRGWNNFKYKFSSTCY